MILLSRENKVQGCNLRIKFEFRALEHKFNTWFCIQKLVVIVYFKDFWYKSNLDFVWQIKLITLKIYIIN